MMMSSATVSIGFLPNRDGSFNSPRSLPLIVLSIISIEDRFERIAFTILFPCITIILWQLRMSCNYKGFAFALAESLTTRYFFIPIL